MNDEGYLMIKSPSGMPGDVKITTSNGTPLGYVQSLEYRLSVGGRARCTITSIMDRAELTAAIENTTIRIELHDNPIKTLWTYYTAKLKRAVSKRTRANLRDQMEARIRAVVSSEFIKQTRSGGIIHR